MDSDLMPVARRLAERGWLPGITHYPNGCIDLQVTVPCGVHIDATEADLHLAAMRQVRKIKGTISFGTLWVTLWIPDPEGIRKTTIYEQPAAQGDTLALLRCLLAACEQSESKETTNG